MVCSDFIYTYRFIYSRCYDTGNHYDSYGPVFIWNKVCVDFLTFYGFEKGPSLIFDFIGSTTHIFYNLYHGCANLIAKDDRMTKILLDWDTVLKFIQANGYKDFMTYFILVVVITSFAIYLYTFIRKEIKSDNKKYK